MTGQISFSCVHCGSKLKAPERKAGNSFPCPKCGTVVKVPAPAMGISTVTHPEIVPTSEIPVRPLTSPVIVMPDSSFRPPEPKSTLPPVEKTLAELHPSMWRMSPASVVIWSLMVPVFGLGLLKLIPWYLQSRATTLIITNRRTTLRSGLLSKKTTEVWHRDVRNVQITQSLFQRMMNVGRIGISSAANSGIEIEVNGIAGPETVRKLIDDGRIS